MKIVKLAVAAAVAASVLMAGAAAMGGTASAGSVPAARTAAHAAEAAATGAWGKAHLVPGLGALNTGHGAGVNQVSCGSPGNCAAVGIYTDAGHHQQVFVANEKNGTWNNALELPGLAALNKGGGAGASGVSCASAGNCAATGNAGNATGHQQVWVADEVGGTWGAPQEIPGFDSLNTGLIADAQSISCPSLGYCATGGQLSTENGPVAYVADERAGGWDLAQQVFGGTVAFNTASADVESVSCGSLGNCAASGSYITTGNVRLAFVVNEVDGSWGNAQNVPGIAALAKGGLSDATSVSCASAGNCAAGGFFRGAHGDGAFLADQSTAASARTGFASTGSARAASGHTGSARTGSAR